ncbi:phage head morphogenesis protein [Arthrobacter sp. VKM Ac-2550]|uniref:phage head morphogenesis protein n=1 Tax=Crystallibacter permensis TaxID=1938888 RepID=UPI00222649EC|nr:phage head morphogenesis protein [Arthrobacter sp. VKM Ac-2550]MCW2131713.1 Phage Mu protein F like protein [Arthrobacter sp. VKM Ac-2550]
MAITPETRRLSDDARAALLRISDEHIPQLAEAWVNAWDEIGPELADSILLLAADAKDGRVSCAQVQRSRRLTAALALIQERIGELADSVGVILEPNLSTAATTGHAAQTAMIGSQLPAVSARLVTDKLTAAPIDAMVARTLEQIHKGTRPLADEVVRIMKTELVRGIAVGDNPKTTARRIVRRAEGRFNGGLTRAAMIARNEVLDMHRAGAKLSDEANADVMAGWRWSASQTARTCPSCLANHGSLHPITEPGPLDHHQGRCARVPVTKSWKELGFDVADSKDTFPDAQEWSGNLTLDTQKTIMGKDRLDLLNSGKIRWADLTTRSKNEGWRDSMTITPVKVLQQRAG